MQHLSGVSDLLLRISVKQGCEEQVVPLRELPGGYLTPSVEEVLALMTLDLGRQVRICDEIYYSHVCLVVNCDNTHRSEIWKRRIRGRWFTEIKAPGALAHRRSRRKQISTSSVWSGSMDIASFA
jgi:hypothetical protein